MKNTPNINKEICTYLYFQWIEPYYSIRKFADDTELDEGTVRTIKKTALSQRKPEYHVPIYVLHKICEFQKIKLSEFFTRLEL